jgi:hypothetical protein
VRRRGEGCLDKGTLRAGDLKYGDGDGLHKCNGVDWSFVTSIAGTIYDDVAGCVDLFKLSVGMC